MSYLSIAKRGLPAVCLLAAAVPILAGASSRNASDARVTIPMTADRWTVPTGTPDVVRTETFPDGALTVKDGFAVLKDQLFSSGTIEFDMKPLEYSDTGIVFRRKEATDGEFFYLRADPDCPAANDCYQYAPITHGRMQWNIYPNYQGGAAISEKGWNHIKLVIAGSHMDVFLTGSALPTLTVPRLQGLTSEGGIAFKGPAVFANLTIDRAPAKARLDREAPAQLEDAGIPSHWLRSPSVSLQSDAPVSTRDATGFEWQPEPVEPNGLVNFSRFMTPTRAASIGWAKTSVYASSAGPRIVDLGFAPQVWVFLNGNQIYQGMNYYYPEAGRLQVDGRLGTRNAVINLPLKQGRNDIMLAVGNKWRRPNGDLRISAYGLGAMLRFEDPSGLRF